MADLVSIQPLIIPSDADNREFEFNGKVYTNEAVNILQTRNVERGVDPQSGLWCIIFTPISGLGVMRWFMPDIAALEAELEIIMPVVKP